ncbi:Asp-tRNA(Asn)/Glu-tRNA(Gln) amidotransferase subunit GatC [Pseudomonadota bacterium]
MSLDHADVKKIAHLARLDVSDGQMVSIAKDLSNILDLVEQLNSADTEGVVPMAHPLHMAQRLRSDEVTEMDHREVFQSIAPQTEDGLYLVPKVIE